jgi:hypothetical protein
MKKILFVIFVNIWFISKSQDYYKTSEQYPTEFSKYSYEAIEWYNNNLDVMVYNFTSIDAHVQKIIKNYPNIQDFDLLVSLLSKPCKNDLEKVRVFYIWIVYSMKYDASIRNEMSDYITKSETLEDNMLFSFKKRRGVCYENSAIFYYMCKKSNIPVGIITGMTLEGNFDLTHAWNIFNYNGKYYFTDVTWGAQTSIKNDNFKNFHFIINEAICKYLYKSYITIYTELAVDYGKKVIPSIRKFEENWVVGFKEYEKYNMVKNNNLDIIVFIDKYVKNLKNIDYKTVIRFDYNEYTIDNMKNWAIKYTTPLKIESEPPLNFIVLNDKIIKKMTYSKAKKYFRDGNIYFGYWNKYYKTNNANISPEYNRNYNKFYCQKINKKWNKYL